MRNIMLAIKPPNQAPNLAIALNNCPVNTIPCAGFYSYLRLIWGDLKSGLSAVWSSPAGLGDLNQINPDVEEQWARTVTEMFLGFKYAGPAQEYNIINYTINEGIKGKEHKFSDKDFFTKLAENDDPAYPIVAACQQLCSMAVVSRGFGVQVIGAGDSSGATKALGGDWFTGNSLKYVPNAFSQKYFGTGSMFAWEGYDPKEKTQYRQGADGCHIAFVLRTNPDLKRIQVFDTSGAGTTYPTGVPYVDPTSIKGSGGHIYDYDWAETIPGPMMMQDNPSPPPPKIPKEAKYQPAFMGIGTLPPSPDLAAAVAKMRRARPLGFARLAFIGRQSRRILFATPLLFMHATEDSSFNFSFARLLWSLRNMAKTDPVYQPVWVIAVPGRELTIKMLEPTNNRHTKLSALLSQAQPGVLTGDGDLVKAKLIHRISCVTAESDGTVHMGSIDAAVQDRILSGPWNKPGWDPRTKGEACWVNWDNQFTDLSYFKGEFDGNSSSWYKTEQG